MSTNLSAQLAVLKARRNPVIFDTNDRFIYFPNHKVAQRSIVRVALADRAIVKKGDEAAWEAKVADIDVDYLASVETFTVVRNPYDRVVSAFTYLQGEGKIDEDSDFPTFVREVLATQGISGFDRHFDCQSEGMFVDGELIPQYTARFETLGEDWGAIAEAIDGPPALPHINMSRRTSTYASYYDEPTKQLISELYADDIANFGYAFDDQPAPSWFEANIKASKPWWLARKAKSKVAVQVSSLRGSGTKG